MLPLAMVTMTLLVCPAGTLSCTSATAKQTFTEQISKKACGIYVAQYGRNPQYDANYARNRFKYTASPGDIFIATCK